MRDFPVPENERELDKFLYMTLYLKRYIPVRADHVRVMKSAVLLGEDGRERTKEGAELEDDAETGTVEGKIGAKKKGLRKTNQIKKKIGWQ